jgi:hypothetical protein
MAAEALIMSHALSGLQDSVVFLLFCLFLLVVLRL